jgi:hypothetical protein
MSSSSGPKDTTLLLYNSKGKIFSVVHKHDEVNGGFTYDPAIFMYNSAEQITKIYVKKQTINSSPSYWTDISNPNDFIYYDSVVYDNKNRISVTYAIITDGSTVPNSQSVSFYKKYYYSSLNDSLLSKVEVYSRDANNIFKVSDAVTFTSYDTLINPFYKDFYWYALVPNNTRFRINPPYSSAYSFEFDGYLTFSPHNCTDNVVRKYSSNKFITNSNSNSLNWTELRFKRIKN